MANFKGLIIVGIIVLACVVGGWAIFSNFNSGPTNQKITNLIESSSVEVIYSNHMDYSFDARLKSDFWSMFGLELNISSMHVKVMGYANFAIDKSFNITQSEDGTFLVELNRFHYKGFEYAYFDTDTSGVPNHIKDENLDDVIEKLHGYVDEYIEDTYMVVNEEEIKNNILTKLTKDVNQIIHDEFGNSIKVSFRWL